MMDIPMGLPLAHVVPKFVFEDGSEYGIERFSIAFNQPADYKGQPQHEVQGGQIMLVLSELVKDSIYEWARDSFSVKNGCISFETQYSNDVLCVEFFRAYCIRLERAVSDRGGVSTSLLISAEIVIVNGVEHDNFWPEKK